MNRFYRLRLLSLIVIISLLLIPVHSVQAQAIISDGKVPAGMVIEQDLMLVDDQIVIDGTVKGDVLAIGASVIVNGEITGSLVALAQQVSVDGGVGGSAYVASLSMDLGANAVIMRGLYYVGASLITARDSYIGRDIYGAFLGGQLSGQLGRDVRAIIGPIEIIRVTMDALNLDFSSWGSPAPDAEAPLPAPTDTPKPESNLLIPATYTGAGLQPLRSAAQASPINPDDVLIAVWEWIKRLLILFLVGLVMLWLIPGSTELWSHKLKQAPLASAGYGLAGAITGFVGVGLLIALVLAVAIGLASLGFGSLAFLLGLLGLASIGVAFAVFLMLLLFASKVIVSYVLGQLLVDALFPALKKQRVLTFLIGLGIYMFLSAIPYLGWVVAITASLLGLGVVWVSWADARHPAVRSDFGAPSLVPAPEVEAPSATESDSAN